MVRLKVDLHTHSSDDVFDAVAFTAETLIDVAVSEGYGALAISCHTRQCCTPALVEYARRRGLLLVPAIELLVEHKHVVVLNPSESAAVASTFRELRAADRRESIVLAPHAFYPEESCLRDRLIEHIDLFDAIEYSSVYLRYYNPNRRAAAVARQYGIPMLGTSDIHALPHCQRTFSWLQMEEVSVPALIAAIRAGRIEVVTTPRRFTELKELFTFFVAYKMRTMFSRKKKGGAAS